MISPFSRYWTSAAAFSWLSTFPEIQLVKEKLKYTQLPHGLHRPLYKQNQHGVSELHTWAHRTSGHQGHKMRSKRLVNLLQGKNPRLQRSGFIPSNYSRKRGPDGKAQASFQWAEADNLLKGGMAPGGQSTSPARGTASKSDCTQTLPSCPVQRHAGMSGVMEQSCMFNTQLTRFQGGMGEGAQVC